MELGKCLASWNCGNIGPMCFSCRFQDKYKPKLNQTIGNNNRNGEVKFQTKGAEKNEGK